MHPPPDPKRPATPGPLSAVDTLAKVVFLYPLLALTVIYGEWLIAWMVLGHAPRPSLDDPKNVAVSGLLHLVSGVLIMGLVPGACAALLLMPLDIAVHRRRAVAAFQRTLVLFAPWVVVLTLLRWDPWKVMYWWLD